MRLPRAAFCFLAMKQMQCAGPSQSPAARLRFSCKKRLPFTQSMVASLTHRTTDHSAYSFTLTTTEFWIF